MEAWDAQYGGGIIHNPNFNNGVEGWKPFGLGKIEARTFKNGNKFIAALNRTLPSDSISQRVLLEEGKLYAFAGNIYIFILFNLLLDKIVYIYKYKLYFPFNINIKV